MLTASRGQISVIRFNVGQVVLSIVGTKGVDKVAEIGKAAAISRIARLNEAAKVSKVGRAARIVNGINRV